MVVAAEVLAENSALERRRQRKLHRRTYRMIRARLRSQHSVAGGAEDSSAIHPLAARRLPLSFSWPSVSPRSQVGVESGHEPANDAATHQPIQMVQVRPSGDNWAVSSYQGASFQSVVPWWLRRLATAPGAYEKRHRSAIRYAAAFIFGVGAVIVFSNHADQARERFQAAWNVLRHGPSSAVTVVESAPLASDTDMAMNGGLDSEASGNASEASSIVALADQSAMASMGNVTDEDSIDPDADDSSWQDAPELVAVLDEAPEYEEEFGVHSLDDLYGRFVAEQSVEAENLLLDTLAASLASEDWQASQWVERTIAAVGVNDIGMEVMQVWIEADPVSAIVYVDNMPDSDLKPYLYGHYASLAAQDDPLATYTWASSLADEDSRNVATSEVILQWEIDNPDELHHFMSLLPDQ